jgi:hypothetical protein
MIDAEALTIRKQVVEYLKGVLLSKKEPDTPSHIPVMSVELIHKSNLKFVKLLQEEREAPKSKYRKKPILNLRQEEEDFYRNKKESDISTALLMNIVSSTSEALAEAGDIANPPTISGRRRCMIIR